MTLSSVSMSIPALVGKLSEEDQARFFDAATACQDTPADIVEKLKKLDQEAQEMVG